MGSYIRLYKKYVLTLTIVLVLIGAISFSFISPKGYFSPLQNDLKNIEKNESQTYTDLSGNPVRIRDFHGKILIVNAWATWMPFSQNELSMLSAVAEKYPEEIQVLAINRMEQAGIARSFMGVNPVSDKVRVLLDPNDSFYTSVGGYAMPETVVYNTDGVIVYHARGVLNESEIMSVIASLLK